MDIIKKITKVVDESSIITGEDLKSRFYHIWKTDISLESICVVLPRNTEQVSEIMKICYENDQEVIIHGGLTNLVGSTKTNNSQIVISLEKMNSIIEIDTESKTVTCESGVILEDLINACKEKDLLLPLNFGARGSNYNKYLPDTYKYYVFVESTGSDYEIDYLKFETIITESLEKGYIEDAVIGKNDKEQTNIWGIREDVSVLADERKYDQHFDISIPTSSIGKIIDKITNELLENKDVKTIFPFGHVADGNIHFIIGKDSDKESITREVNEIIYC